MASNIDIQKNASGVANYLLPTKPLSLVWIYNKKTGLVHLFSFYPN